MDTTPYWSTSAHLPRFPSLASDMAVDVVVVGAGLTGITTAYLLKRAGKRVALLERRRCAGADTGHTTAHLTCAIDTSLSDLVNRLGDDHARAVWDAGLAAISEIDDIAQREEISCGFSWVPAFLHLAAAVDDEPKERDELIAEAALAERLGFDARFVEAAPGIGRPAMELINQARFHPRQYLAGLLNSIDGAGSVVFEHTNVEDVVESPRHVIANGHAISCDHVILATHNPIMGNSGIVAASYRQTKLSLYTSYAVGGRTPAGAWPDALFWDTASPYQYIRTEPHRGFDYVVVGGADHKTGQERDTEGVFRALEEAARRAVPQLDITHRWSGQVIETPDGLPLIGETSPGQFIATGFAGNGMTHGTLAAMMACDYVAGRSSPWTALFAANRTAMASGFWDYLKENADYPYYLVRDRFAGSDSRSLRAVQRGSGQVVTHKGARVAAYRDQKGTLTLRSAVCPHLGCLVQWNNAERTWDCPCHGSRFAATGAVIAGPAEGPLAAVKEPQE
jgi:glycine/D-amino acid oxidase-like deaminating enzyme/nitrite reductase/ring-hydroxylating ferredoxin subunit